jgi:hypothetical protein
MNTARSFFIVAAIPFSLFAVLLLFLDRSLGSGGASFSPMSFVLCGGIYIYGSIYALRGDLPLPLLVFAGGILNFIGAFAWVPFFRFSDGALYGLVGLGLAVAWIFAIVEEYRAERR